MLGFLFKKQKKAHGEFEELQDPTLFSHFGDLPEKIRSRIALVDGCLHISEEMRGNKLMVDYVSEQKRNGIMQHKFYNPIDFDEKFSRQTIPEKNKAMSDNDIENLLKSLLQKAYEEKATDIHIKDLGSHCLIKFRIMGLLSDYTSLDVEKGRALITGIYNSMCSSRSDSMHNTKQRQDARIVDKKFLPSKIYSVRVHTEPTECVLAPDGVASCMYLRLLYDSTKAEGTLSTRLDTLGFLPEQIEAFEFLSSRTGLVLISGATGHGKSTVLKHSFESMAVSHPQKNFRSIEDPTEYIIKGVDQHSIKTSDENRGKAYKEAIAGNMRSDIDTLLIGELRYAEAIVAAMDASQTGHGVWASIHASDAFSIILRIVTLLGQTLPNALEYICEPSVLAGIEYQRLIPILCPHCSKLFIETENYNPQMVKKINKIFDEIDNIRVLGDGCEECNNRGLVSQKVVAEVIATDVQMLNYLRQGKFAEAKKYWIDDKKGITHVQHALRLVKQGLADPMITEDRLGLPLDIEN